MDTKKTIHHFCTNCQQVTPQITTPYDPDDPDSPLIYLCLKCGELDDWVIEVSEAVRQS